MADTINDSCDASGLRLHRTKGNPDQLSQQKLADFINTSSRFFFEILQLPTSFLGRDPQEWLDDADCMRAKQEVKWISVVNDAAERGVAMATTLCRKITRKEDEKQRLFQVVEDHRRRFPDAKKKTVLPNK